MVWRYKLRKHHPEYTTNKLFHRMSRVLIRTLVISYNFHQFCKTYHRCWSNWKKTNDKFQAKANIICKNVSVFNTLLSVYAFAMCFLIRVVVKSYSKQTCCCFNDFAFYFSFSIFTVNLSHRNGATRAPWP